MSEFEKGFSNDVEHVVDMQYQGFIRDIGFNEKVPDSVKKMLVSDQDMHGLPPFKDVVKFHFARHLVQANAMNGHEDEGSLHDVLEAGLDQFGFAYTYHIDPYEKTYSVFDSYREDGRTPTEVYLGRDGIYAYLGRKAQDLARQRTSSSAEPDKITPKYLVYSSDMREAAGHQIKEEYLKQEGITQDKDPLFFDIGFVGSIPDEIMSIMDFDKKGREDRIKLLVANAKSRELPLGQSVDISVVAIENSAKPESRASDLEVNEHGKVVPVATPAEPAGQFKFMMLRQAIARHFWIQEHERKD